MTTHYDVLVVGSGFGGSVTALRLTEKGYRVGVLEAGARFEDADFPATSFETKKWLFAPAAGMYGIQRIDMIKDCLILAGAGVGGGSLVYANTLYEPLDAFYRDPSWSGITDWKAELAPYYDQAKRMLGVVPNPLHTPSDEVMKKRAQHAASTMLYPRELKDIQPSTPVLKEIFAAAANGVGYNPSVYLPADVTDTYFQVIQGLISAQISGEDGMKQIQGKMAAVR